MKIIFTSIVLLLALSVNGQMCVILNDPPSVIYPDSTYNFIIGVEDGYGYDTLPIYIGLLGPGNTRDTLWRGTFGSIKTLPPYSGCGCYLVPVHIDQSIKPGSYSNLTIYPTCHDPGDPSPAPPVTISANPITSIITAYQQNKVGMVTIYDSQGRLIKTCQISNYTDGLQQGQLYIYNIVYSDGDCDKGKFIIE